MANKQNLLKTRFEAIESLLLWEGEITNARLRQLFELQSTQASRLIAEYRQTYPSSIKEDSKHKRFVPEPGFTAQIATGTLDEYASWMATLPTNLHHGIEDGRIDLTAISPAIFSALRQASSLGRPIQIRYESMTHPKGTDRIIFPRTIIRIGRRWHVRAWCCTRQDYRDFALGRIRAVSMPRGPDLHRSPPLGIDEAWEKQVTIRLAAHRALDSQREKVIRNEYFDGTAARRVATRACLAAYVIQDLRASIDPERQQPPEYQMEVTNLSELRKYLFRP